MEYKGKLYGKVGESYFPLEESTEDIKRLHEGTKVAAQMINNLSNELTRLENENRELKEQLRELEKFDER